MKKEIGKWFLDIAKYIATAVLLTQLFGGVTNKGSLILAAIVSIVVIFTIGLIYLHDDEVNNKKRKGISNGRCNYNAGFFDFNGYSQPGLFPLL